MEHWNANEKGVCKMTDIKDENIVEKDVEQNSASEKENKEKKKPFEKFKEEFDKLEDSPFKEFYQNNPKELKYLFEKVKRKELQTFATHTFSMADVLQCLYVKAFLEKSNIKKKEFKQNVILKANEAIPEKNDEYKIRKYSVVYIHGYLNDNKKMKFLKYDSFKKGAQRHLTTVLEYAFANTDIVKKFKVEKHYEFTAIEAMFMFFIMDDKHKQEIKHIRSQQGHLIERRYIQGLKRYAIAIAKMRNDSAADKLAELYEERIESLESDIYTAWELAKKVLEEVQKNDEADAEKIVEMSKKCIKKFKKVIKKYDDSKKKDSNLNK